MKKIICLLFAVITMLSLLSCKKSCSHKDKNNDYICDKCEVTLHTKDGTVSKTPDSDAPTPETCSHDFLPPTCTHDGFCALCGMKGEKSKGHTPGEFIVNLPALCGIAGEEICPCVSCEEILEVREIPALQHEWVDGICINCNEPEA